MTQFAHLPPDIQALERERGALSRRLAYLSPNSRRGRALRREHVELTNRLVALEQDFVAAPDEQPVHQETCVTPTSLDDGHETHRGFWWVDK